LSLNRTYPPRTTTFSPHPSSHRSGSIKAGLTNEGEESIANTRLQLNALIPLLPIARTLRRDLEEEVTGGERQYTCV